MNNNLQIWTSALIDILDSSFKYADWNTISLDSFQKHIYAEFKNSKNWFYSWTKNVTKETINKLIIEVLGDLWN